MGPPDPRHYSRMQSNQLRLGVATLTVGDGTKTADEVAGDVHQCCGG